MLVWTNPRHALHVVPAGFPEIPQRLDWAAAACRDAGVAAEAASAEEISVIPCEDLIRSVHVDDRLARLRLAADPQRGRLDTPDCPVAPGTPEAALDALRLTLFALSAVLRSKASGFALVRPPGHHATSRSAMGFCYLNNVALAARAARQLGRRRVAILDLDVHHGNGTQEIFYRDGEVFFCSLHEHPRMQYPGSGFVHERGVDAGLGATMNLPLPTGCSGERYLSDLTEQALPAIESHKAELLLVSAGFDAHRADPLGGLQLVGEDYRRIGRELALLSRRQRLPALFVLEGGYDPGCFSDGLRPLLEGWLSER